MKERPNYALRLKSLAFWQHLRSGHLPGYRYRHRHLYCALKVARGVRLHQNRDPVTAQSTCHDQINLSLAGNKLKTHRNNALLSHHFGE